MGGFSCRAEPSRAEPSNAVDPPGHGRTLVFFFFLLLSLLLSASLFLSRFSSVGFFSFSYDTSSFGSLPHSLDDEDFFCSSDRRPPPPSFCLKTESTARNQLRFFGLRANLKFSWCPHTLSALSSDMLQGFADAPALETVLEAGELLYIPSFWYHYIVSEGFNVQCNARSGLSLRQVRMESRGERRAVGEKEGEGQNKRVSPFCFVPCYVSEKADRNIACPCCPSTIAA